MKKFFVWFIALVLITLLAFLSQSSLTDKDDSILINNSKPSSSSLTGASSVTASTMASSLITKSNTVFSEKSVVKAKPTTEQLLSSAKTIRRCKGVPKTQDELNAWITEANSLGEPYAYIEDVSSRFDVCSAVNRDNDDFIKILLSAIEQGSDDAVEELWSVADAEYFESLGLTDQPSDVKARQRANFVKMKYELAHKIALTGGEKSQLRLVKGYLHFDPAIKRSNIVKSVAYAEFAMQTTTNNEFYLMLAYIKKNCLKRMTVNQIVKAEQLASKLLENNENNQLN